jgi:hypothetical protein
MQQRIAAVAVAEPEVLVGGDVREVPHERGHERVDLALELRVGQVRDQRERALAGVTQGLLRVGHRPVHHTPGSEHRTPGPIPISSVGLC